MNNTVVLADLGSPNICRQLEISFSHEGQELVHMELPGSSWTELLRPKQASVLLLAVSTLTADHLYALQTLQNELPMPVVVMAEQHGLAVNEIVAAGVQVYLVEPPRREKLALVISLALERFKQWQGLRTELNQVNQKLSERKLIEKAKGILMQQKGISEQEAYQQIRKSAMNQGQTMSELASRIISIVEMLD